MGVLLLVVVVVVGGLDEAADFVEDCFLEILLLTFKNDVDAELAVVAAAERGVAGSEDEFRACGARWILDERETVIVEGIECLAVENSVRDRLSAVVDLERNLGDFAELVVV